MYNLKIDGQQVTNLRLSGENIAKIFTGQITNWDDPALAADNRRSSCPISPSFPWCAPTGPASSFEFSEWMISQYPVDVERLLLSDGSGAGLRPDVVLPDRHAA